MIVFDLICRDGGHKFEGWFGSSNDYDAQQKAGFISCPACGCNHVEKALMTPNIGVKVNQSSIVAEQSRKSVKDSSEQRASAISNSGQVPADYQEMISKLANAQEKILKKSEWVGDKFAEKARAIFYGDADEKLIHGTATQKDAADMVEEGIDIAPLPIPITPPKLKN